MPFAVALYVEQPADSIIRDLWKLIAAVALPSPIISFSPVPVIIQRLLEVHAEFSLPFVDYTDHLRRYFCIDIELPRQTTIVEMGLSHATRCTCKSIFTIGVRDKANE